jgi:hypothetical protein
LRNRNLGDTYSSLEPLAQGIIFYNPAKRI